ncbi:adenylyltransferase/cytidyltransferase family protein [Cytobacillus pseudoceanisediminis]|uniref:adenylyltransferase/cytidyltransferase family protein n=1 Tax=Cytobacillus pseudoceanisediminis TaxID=3051614 RepID=UPI003C2AF830
MRNKLLNKEELLNKNKQIKERNKNLKIVLAGGCFDIFHVGHLDYLELSRELGDILIVAVNSDKSIKRIKGQPPVFQSKHRTKVLAALEVVDYVYIFPEDNLCGLLGELKPDIFVKGIDYKGIYFPEMSVAEDFNIEIKCVGKEKISSSSLLRKNLI